AGGKIGHAPTSGACGGVSHRRQLQIHHARWHLPRSSCTARGCNGRCCPATSTPEPHPEASRGDIGRTKVTASPDLTRGSFLRLPLHLPSIPVGGEWLIYTFISAGVKFIDGHDNRQPRRQLRP